MLDRIYHFYAAFTMMTSDGMLTVMEGQTVQVCFDTTVSITRMSFEIDLEVDPSATNATNNGTSSSFIVQKHRYWFMNHTLCR